MGTKISAAFAANPRTTFDGTEQIPLNDGTTNAAAGLVSKLAAYVATTVSVISVTTKGDLQGFSTVAARVPVGVDGQLFKADSTQALGLRWADDVWTQIVAISDLVTALTTGTGEGYFDMPFAATLTEVIGTVQTASTSGLPQFAVKKNGTTVLSTNITIDATEVSSLTAATAPVISVTTAAKGDRYSFDIVAAGTGTKGAQITCTFKKP